MAYGKVPMKSLKTELHTQEEREQAAPHLDRVVEGIRVVIVAMVKLLGRKELDPLTGGDATEELIPLTMLPMPIQKAMVSPVNRPTMAPCPEIQPTLLSQGPPQTFIPIPRTAEHLNSPVPSTRISGKPGVTHKRVGTREEHPQAEKSQQWPSNHAKDAECCLESMEGEKNAWAQRLGPQCPVNHQLLVSSGREGLW